jgi:hypothetical protein
MKKDEVGSGRVGFDGARAPELGMAKLLMPRTSSTA